MSRRRASFAALAAVAVAIVLYGAWAFVHHASPTASNESGSAVAPAVTIAVARFGTYTDTIEAQGRIGPPAGSSAKLTFAQGGIVQTITVRVGDRVTRGEPLAEIDRSTLAAALAQAQADARAASASYNNGSVPTAGAAGASARLALAQTKLNTLRGGGPAALSSRISADAVARQAAIKVSGDEAAVARDEQLLSAGVIATKELDAARAQLASDRADQRSADARVSSAGTDFQAAVKQAEADVATARNDLQVARSQSGVLGGQASSAQARLGAARIAYANGVLSASADGVVLTVLKHPGEFVDSTQPVIEVGPALGSAVTLSVPSESARRIAVGDSVSLRAQGARQTSTRGRIIAVVPAVDPTTQLATVVVNASPPGALSGDAITATVVVGRTRGIIVPSSAIVQDPQSGKTVVFVREAHPKAGESGFAMRAVDVRASDATRAVLAAGLKPGEAVAARGGYSLLAPVGG